MAAFNYAVKTEKTIEQGQSYYTVVARGTLKEMKKYARLFDALSDTVASRITRERDGAILQEYSR